jgi:hypothetical protein
VIGAVRAVLVIVGALAGKAVAVTVLPAWEVVPAVIAPQQWTVAAAVARVAAAVLSKALAAAVAQQPAPARAAARVGEVVAAVPGAAAVVVDAAEEAAAVVGKASQIPLSGTIGSWLDVRCQVDWSARWVEPVSVLMEE